MSNRVLERLVAERDQVGAMIDSTLGAVQEGERDPTESERELLTRHRARLGELEPQIVELVELEEQRAAAKDARAFLEPGGPRTNGDGNGQLQRTSPPPANEPIYRTFAEYARDELIRRFDVIASRAGGPAVREAASERLTRAIANTISTDVPGLITPQHLTEIVDVINKNRPIVGASRSLNLVSGTVTYPRITARPTVAVQATEKTEVASAKMTVALNTVNAKVFAGAGDLSWQAINWTTPDALSLYFDLMAEAYATATEAEAAAHLTGAGYQVVGAPASASFADWYSAIAKAAGMVYTASGRAANAIVASIADAFYLLGMVTNATPAFGAGGSINLTGQGSIGGLQLIASRAITAGNVYVADMGTMLVAEAAGAPVELRAVEPNLAGMEVGVVGGFLAERVLASAVAFIDVSLVNPTLQQGREPTPPSEETPRSGK